MLDMNKTFIKPNIMPIYKKRVYEKRRENISEVLNDKGTIKKVANFAERYGYSETRIWDALNEDNDLLVLAFAKDPAKQGIHQQIACSYIATFPFIYEMEQLPVNDEERTLFCYDGKVFKRKEIDDPRGIKSIDFHWKYMFNGKELNFYASHKYTFEDGGAQDNQFNDVLAYNLEAKKCNNPDIYFFSITDGEYYLKPYHKDKTFSGSKLEYYKEKSTGERNGATNTNNLLPDMIPIIKQWLENNFRKEEYEKEMNKLNYVMDFYL